MNIMKTLMKYRHYLPLHIRFGRSSLARSDTAGSSITKTHIPRVIVFRPPRIDLACRIGKSKSRLVDTSQWRTPLVHGRSILARSDTANIAIITPPKNDSTCRPPLRKWVKLNDIWRNIFAERAQWRTPFVQCIDTRENATSVQGWRGMPV